MNPLLDVQLFLSNLADDNIMKYSLMNLFLYRLKESDLFNEATTYTPEVTPNENDPQYRALLNIIDEDATTDFEHKAMKYKVKYLQLKKSNVN